jgi:hypothetical protein
MRILIAISFWGLAALSFASGLSCDLEGVRRTLHPTVSVGAPLRVEDLDGVLTNHELHETDQAALKERSRVAAQVKLLKETYRPGDCIVRFQTKTESRQPLFGGEGILLIRGSKVVQEILLKIS